MLGQTGEPSRRITFTVCVISAKNLSPAKEEATSATKVRFAIDFPTAGPAFSPSPAQSGVAAGTPESAPATASSAPAPVSGTDRHFELLQPVTCQDESATFDKAASTAAFVRDVGEQLLDSLLNDPLSVTLFDCTDPASEVALGCASVSLSALAAATSTEVSGWFPVVAVPSDAANPGPQLEVSVRANDPLLTESEKMRANWMTLSIGPMTSLPATCLTASAPQFYRFSLWFQLRPDAGEGSRVLIAGGRISSAATPGAPSAEQQPNAAVDWGCTRRYYVSPKIAEAWRSGIAAGTHSPLVLEIRRELSPDFKSTVEDTAAQRYRGHASVDLRALLTPGTTSLSGVFPVVLCNHGSDPSWAVPASKSLVETAEGELQVESKAPRSRSRERSKGKSGKEKEDGGGEDGGEGKKKPRSSHGAGRAKAKGKTKPSKLNTELEKSLKADEEQKPYDKAATSLGFSLNLTKPLVPLPPPPKAKQKASDFLPKRKQLPRHQQLREATAEFRHQIEQVVADLSGEYAALFGAQSLTTSGPEWAQGKEERRKQFFFRLNSTPAYFLMKEKIKRAIVRVVREKFSKTSSLSKDELSSFVNELFVFLVDQMHSTISKMSESREAAWPVVGGGGGAGAATTPAGKAAEPAAGGAREDVLKRLAFEHELAGDTTAAAKYHQRRIALDKSDPQRWFEFGMFCLRTGSTAKGDECLEEALNLHGGSHAPSLLALGCRAFGTQADKSLAFIEEAAKLESQQKGQQDGGMAKAILALAGDADEVEVGGTAAAAASAAGTRAHHQPEVLEKIVQFLLDTRSTVLAERVLSLAISEHGSRAELVLALAKLHGQNGRLRWAEDYAQRALDQSASSSRSWATLSEIFSAAGNSEEAIAHMRKAVELQGAGEGADDDKLKGVLRLGKLCEEAKQYEEAKEQYLKACKARPSASCFWLGVGRSCYNLGEFDEAERCLAEANILDIEDPDVWGALCLTCLKLGREADADESVSHALHLGLSNVGLLCDIGAAYLEHGNPALSEKVMRAATTVAGTENVLANRLLADSLMRGSKFEEALPIYEKIASSKAAQPTDRDHATQRMAELVAIARGDPDL